MIENGGMENRGEWRMNGGATKRYFPRFSFSVVTGFDAFPVVDPILIEIFLGGALLE